MKHSIRHLRMEEAKDGTEAEGGDILGGEKAPAEAAPEQSGKVAEGWLAGVENEWANDSSMQSIKSIEDLAKGYVHAQRLVGKDKIVMPSEHATDEERREFLHKLGLPKSQEEYGVAPEEGSQLSEEFAKEFKERAFAQGIMPNQAQDMMNWYEEKLGVEQSMQAQLTEQGMADTVTSLKEQYGQAYESKIHLANKVLEDTMDEGTINAMRESGLLSNKEFIQTMVKIGEGFVQEGTFGADPKADGRLSPSEAQAKIGSIQADPAHPYHSKAHPNHAAAVKEVNALFEYAG